MTGSDLIGYAVGLLRSIHNGRGAVRATPCGIVYEIGIHVVLVITPTKEYCLLLQM